ncbi:MAG: hypothetical protein ACXIUM_02600 [Wenzhouxiangella sp.]
MKAQSKLMLAVAGSLLALGLSVQAQAQAVRGASGHAGPAPELITVHHVHRPGASPHGSVPPHRSATVIHRSPRMAHASPQARMADRYARTAVSQAHTAWQFGCAQSHPRWSTAFHDHFQWAYGRSLHETQREIERRERVLARCVAW